MPHPDTQAEFDAVHRYSDYFASDLLPVPPTILSYLSLRRREDPFLTALPSVGPEVTLSYGQLDLLSGRLARWLRGELGETKVVGIIPVNDAPSVLGIVALMRAGYSILLLSPADPPERMRQQAAALSVATIFRSPSIAAEVLPEAHPLSTTDASLDSPGNWTDSPIDPSANAFFLATSGSTATSKLVLQSQYNAAVNAAAVVRHHGLQPGDRFLGCLPIHHVNGLHFTILAALASGGHAILAQAFDPFAYRHWLERFRPCLASVVPSILEALVETWRQPVMPREFRYFVSAAAPLSAQTARRVFAKLGVRVLQGYGLTETTNFSTTMPVELPDETYRSLALECEIPSVGVALFGNDVAILSPDGHRLRPGETGEICMRGHNVMTGYAENPEATSDAFRHGWFHSQDLGFEFRERVSGSRFFVITGRIKNIAKVRGESVSLEEMERVLLSHPAVRDAACVALPHRLLGDEVSAGVVALEVTDLELRSHLRKMFAAAVLPGRIVRLAAIPRTPTGKVRRAELAKLLACPEGTEPST